jgi:hypothetical protein
VLVSIWGLAPSILAWFAGALLAQPPHATSAASARTWLGHETLIEQHLQSAQVTSLEDIGTGVTHPRRAHLTPTSPVESLVFKVLPPGRRNGYWESYKSEIAAYELDKLLNMGMVPPAIERRIDGEMGAGVMWIEGIRSVKQAGGKVPSAPIWGRSVRMMLTFDNLIGNPDRNAGNILLGPPGEMILIDHSRAFITDTKLPQPIQRVDAQLWGRISTLTRDDLRRALGPWIDDEQIDAMLERRTRMKDAIDRLVKKKGRALVIVQ